MNLTVTHSGTCSDDGMAFCWSIDSDDGNRIAEQAGQLAHYLPDEYKPLTVELEALLAALEWLQPLQFLTIASLHLQPSEAVLDALERPAGPESPTARLVAYIEYFQRKGVHLDWSAPHDPRPVRKQYRRRKSRGRAATKQTAERDER